MTRIREKPGSRGLVRLVASAVLLMLAAAALLYVTIGYLRVQEVELPDLRGRPYAEAAQALRRLDLVPVAYPDNVPGATAESVTTQTPAPGSIVRQGRNVSLGVHRPPESAAVPVLVGLTLDEAINTARAMNLPLATVEYAYGDQPSGRIVRQVPAPGEQLFGSDGVTVVVSRGREPTNLEMPDVTGMALEQARRRLEEAGFRGIQERALGVTFDSPGTVRSQEPLPGSQVSVGTPVVLGYHLPATRVVPVPDVVGRRADVAGRLLRAAGLQVGEISYREDQEALPGVVLAATPGSYTLRGAPVALTINGAQGEYDGIADANSDLAVLPGGGGEAGLGNLFGDEPAIDPGVGLSDGGVAPGTVGGEDVEPGDGGRRISVTFDPATLGVRSLVERDYELRLVVQDDRGERTVIDRQVAAGDTVSAVVVVYGDALLQTYINGIFFQAWRP